MDWLSLIQNVIFIVLPIVLYPLTRKYLKSEKSKAQAQQIAIIAKDVVAMVKLNNKDLPILSIISQALSLIQEQLPKVDRNILTRAVSSAAYNLK